MLRTCRKCGVGAETEEDLTLFVTDKRSQHGKANCCLDCRREEYRSYDYNNKPDRRHRNSEYNRIRRLKYKYGLTEQDWDDMYEEQLGRCLICEKHQSELGETLCVDHCHTSGEVRGLLCRSCNLVIGNAKEDIAILQNAIIYIKEYC